ncbi:MAG: glycosyltransferase family 39 protein [bacterium]
MSKTMLNILKKNRTLLLIIMAIGLLLRFMALMKYGDFWFDEMFSFTYSQKPIIESLKFWSWETNPPLHMLILKVWFVFFPANEFFARLPSVLFGVLSIFFIHSLGKAMLKQRTALVAAGLMTFAPLQIFYSATARGYSLLILLAIVSTLLFHKIYIARQNSSTRIKILFAIINLLLIYTHLTAWTIIIVHLALLWCINKKQLKNYILINTLPMLAYLIWAIPAIMNKMTAEVINNAWFFNIQSGFSDIIESIQLIIIGPTDWKIGLIIILLIIFAWIAVIAKQIKTKIINQNFIFISALAITPIIIMGLFSIWSARFFIISAPFLFILISYLATNIIKSRIALCALIALMLGGGLFNFYAYSLPINQWSRVNEYIEQNFNENKRQIFICNNYIYNDLLERYYNKKLPTLMYNDSALNHDEYFIKQNFIRFNREEQVLLDWLDENNIKDYEEIFYLENRTVGIPIDKALEKKGWLLKDESSLRFPEYSLMKLYEKNI